MKIILSGEPISSQEAHSLGLVAELSQPGTVLDETVKFASLLAQKSSSSLSLAKQAICQGKSLPPCPSQYRLCQAAS
jgi:enoyl-CoA hydratase